jgi:hypothetical protein
MRLSDFHTKMNDEFGASFSELLLKDLVLLELADQTGQVALASGVDPKNVWLAICKAQDVPPERWQGLNKKTKKQHADK